MKTIVITEGAFVAACHPDFPLRAILDEQAPPAFANAFIRVGDTSILIATEACAPDCRLLVLGTRRVFATIPDSDSSTVFERCIRLALRSYDKKIALNPSWMPFRQNSRTSLFAFGDSTLRLIAERNYGEAGYTYVYDTIEASQAQDLSTCIPDEDAFLSAVDEMPTLLAQAPTLASREREPIELEHLATQSIAKGFAYHEWLPLLSAQQRNFVERDVTGPLRVRGAAGTGKTLAMVMKALRLAKDNADHPKRILFLTHSWAMAGQVDEMLGSIGRDIPTAETIEVYPLLEISRQRDYSLIGRRPLGLDSEAGKRETLSIIGNLVDDFLQSDWVAYRGGCSEAFVDSFEAPVGSRARRNVAWDILVEFGCVLAAQGLLGRSNDRERYIRIRRVGYMMPLSNASEKEVVFRLWVAFLAHLRDAGLISSDQIISDYLNELQTFYWEAKRIKDGYDYVFVDEMHLFNAQERLIFHNLLANGDEVPKVILALDPKQSPREVFAEIADERDDRNRSIYERARLPNPDKVDFINVYRYTTEIAALSKAVLDAVPALDMDDDWNLPGGNSVVGSGAVPTYYVEKDSTAGFKRLVSLSRKYQVESRKFSGQVGVLCMDYERFSVFSRAAAGQYSSEFYVIKSRDDVERLRYMNRRIVISTPEYVAGLQFDTVILVDVNGNLVPDSAYRGHQERQFLSELYLGISRAQRILTIISSLDGDGLSPYLRGPENRGLLEPASM